jgi:hypothetical protein
VRGQCPAGGSPTEDLGPCTPQVNGPSEWTRPAQALASGRPTCPQSNVFGTSDRDFDGHDRLSVGCGSATGVRDQRPAMATPPGLRHIGGCWRLSVRRPVVCGTPATYSPKSYRAPLWTDRVFLWPIRAVPSAIHSAASSTVLAPSALAESAPVASSNWRTTSAASRPRSLTFRPCARAQFRTASLCASEPLLLAPPPEPVRLGALRRLAVALFAPPVRRRVPCPGPRAARCGRSL